ncbi:MAG TPA: LacI family DNA-binding transcriptional regulator [Candidatus Sulfotelmatobacter sp.]|nr:LacI family DNA-binding transcriptional regulator [Candidatus Sulfotelmatobacter sp.]
MTLQEIARRSNVSIATVSRIINRVPTVNPALARRVQKVIEKEGYFPNTQARALVSGRSRLLGLIAELTDPGFPDIVQTFGKLAIQHNYGILLSPLIRDPRLLEPASRQMIERRIDGLAILGSGVDPVLIESFTSRKVPVVAIDIDSLGSPLLTVQIDYRHGIRQAVQHLAALGHRRIAFVSGPAHLKTAIRRKQAFDACMEEIDLETPPEMLIEGDNTIAAGAQAVSALMSLSDRPTAVFCSNDLTAIGAMRKAFELSVNIPKDLSVVGFDDIPSAQCMTPPLTTVQMPQNQIASTAFRALLDLAEPAFRGDSRAIQAIATNLVLRSSTTLAPRRISRFR